MVKYDQQKSAILSQIRKTLHIPFSIGKPYCAIYTDWIATFSTVVKSLRKTEGSKVWNNRFAMDSAIYKLRKIGLADEEKLYDFVFWYHAKSHRKRLKAQKFEIIAKRHPNFEQSPPDDEEKLYDFVFWYHLQQLKTSAHNNWKHLENIPPCTLGQLTIKSR